MKKVSLLLLALVCSMASMAAVTITKTAGWFESGYVTWTNVSGLSYDVYVRPEGGTYTQLDKELVRNYGSYGRADALGLKAGKYQLKVVASNGEEAESDVFTAVAHDRNGFAHDGWSDGIGAYKNDGTLKDGTRVLYLTAANAKTIKCNVMVDKTDTELTGIQEIIAKLEKGTETRPICVRIIGTIKKADLDKIGSSAEGLQVKGKNGTTPMNLTIEGVGNDATIHGFGFLIRNACSVEIRNFASMICMDDCMSLDTDNHHVWVHNMDFFYGGTGSDADQAKGDGTVDIKGKSSHVTVSYNHFWDSGKCSLGGMKGETTDCWMTYHHNWFDHSDSRHPRIRTAFYHCYNNYYDGISKYGVGVTCGGSAFVESNYFRNCKYPMLASKQGTDAEGDGTFSGEAGGVNKAYNNKIINPRQLLYWAADKEAGGEWDAVLVETRDGAVSAKAFSGGTAYNAAADEAARKAVPASAIDPVEDVALICRGEKAGREGLGAGRIDGGDFQWTFYYPTQDDNYAVITELKQAVLNYKSTLVGFYGESALPNGGATETVNAGDGKGKTQAIDESTNTPVWGGGSISDDESLVPYIIGIDGDYYWFNAENDAQTKQYIADGTIIMVDGSASYGSDKKATSSKDPAFVDPYVGAIAATTSTGYATFYCPDSITVFAMNATRSGSAAGEIQVSNDGTSFTKVDAYSTKAKGNFKTTTALPEPALYVRVTNTSGGTLYIHGIKVFKVGKVVPEEGEENDLTMLTTSKELAANATYQLTQGTDFTTSSTGKLSYSSSNSAVAKVDATGLITALSEGTATIKVVQANDGTYKSGSATMTVTVKDMRAESQFALTSAATVALKVGGTVTAQITTTGAAGTVTYTSNKTSVATVDANGLITAVAAGTAVITVMDAGSATVKAKSLSVTVNVTKDMSGETICHFLDKKPSVDMVTVTGNYSTSKGSVTYGGKEYGTCVKMESSTMITITPSSACEITLVFGSSEGSKAFKLDDVNLTTNAEGKYTFTAEAGKTYTLKKVDSINLFLIIFTAQGGSEPDPDPENPDPENPDPENPDPTEPSNVIFDYETNVGTIEFFGTAVEKKGDGQKYNTNTTSPAKNLEFANSLASADTINHVTTYNYVLITPVAGGFMAGDVVSIAGYYNNSAEKQSAVGIYLTKEDEAPIWQTADFINGRLVAGEPTVQTYTLTQDAPNLIIARCGKTRTNVLKLTVTRSNPETGISETVMKVKVQKVLCNGQIFILREGRMYTLQGQVVE